MHLLKLSIFITLYSLLYPALAPGNQDLLPASEAFKLSIQTTAPNQALLLFQIADGYYLYKNKIKAESTTPDIALQTLELPTGIAKHDEFFGDMEIYRNQLQIPVRFENPKQIKLLELAVRYQGCADMGVCYPPQKTVVSASLPSNKPADDNPVKQFVNGIKDIKLDFFQDELLPAEQAFQFYAQIKDPETLTVNWTIAENYYLYRGKLNLSLIDSQGVSLGQYQVPNGEEKFDEAFGQVEILRGILSFDVPLIRQNGEPKTFTLLAKYQGCADRGVCYPPMQTEQIFQLPAAVISGTTQSASTAIAPASDSMQIVQALHHDAFWLTLLSFLGFGLLLSLTPCVFPMIPILSGIIVGQSENITWQRGFLLSLCFVFASALTYMVFGMVAAVFGSNLQVYLQEPWVIITFSGLFILLSLSMFGFYHLEIPKSWQTRIHNTSENYRNTGYLGVGIMGALSSLIVGPCVAAPLAGALIYIGQTGDMILGGSALFMMGLGMGAPLLVIGASAGSLLPKAGPWLNNTKAIFGVLMLGVAVWMLDRVIPSEITMLLWALLLIIPAIYLSAIDPLPESASNWRKLWKGTGLVSLVYGVLLLIGLAMGNSNPLQPLAGLNTDQPGNHSKPVFAPVKSLAQLQSKVAQAASQNQWVMLDFYTDWCISCKEMESYTFTDPAVKQKLQHIVLLQADVTDNTPEDMALLKQFNLIGPPAILFFDPKQQERNDLRVIGYQDAKTFIRLLNQTQT